MAHYMEPMSMLFDEAEPEDGDDTTEAVENDINPSVDTATNSNGSGGKNKDQSGGGGGGDGKKGKGKQNGQHNANKSAKKGKTPSGPPVSETAETAETQEAAKSKRAEKIAARYAAEEEEGNAPRPREKSPTEGIPEAKRAKHEVVIEVESAAGTA